MNLSQSDLDLLVVALDSHLSHELRGARTFGDEADRASELQRYLSPSK